MAIVSGGGEGHFNEMMLLTSISIIHQQGLDAWIVHEQDTQLRKIGTVRPSGGRLCCFYARSLPEKLVNLRGRPVMEEHNLSVLGSVRTPRTTKGS